MLTACQVYAHSSPSAAGASRRLRNKHSTPRRGRRTARRQRCTRRRAPCRWRRGAPRRARGWTTWPAAAPACPAHVSGLTVSTLLADQDNSGVHLQNLSKWSTDEKNRPRMAGGANTQHAAGRPGQQSLIHTLVASIQKNPPKNWLPAREAARPQPEPAAKATEPGGTHSKVCILNTGCPHLGRRVLEVGAAGGQVAQRRRRCSAHPLLGIRARCL